MWCILKDCHGSLVPAFALLYCSGSNNIAEFLALKERLELTIHYKYLWSKLRVTLWLLFRRFGHPVYMIGVWNMFLGHCARVSSFFFDSACSQQNGVTNYLAA